MIWANAGVGLTGVVIGAVGASVIVSAVSCREMTLDAGWAGVLGASIGVLGTLAASFLSHSLQNARTHSLAEKRRQRLKRELESPHYTWRSIERLCAVIGADESATVELLIEIDARTSQTSKKVWALESKAPWPDENKVEGQ
jgi:hypothetical protein